MSTTTDKRDNEDVAKLRRYVEHLWWIRDGSKCELCDEIEIELRDWKREKHDDHRQANS